MREDVFILVLFALASMVDPHAAVGASAGCAFNLALPKTDKESAASRVILPMVSLILGYAVGESVGAPNAMWAAVVVAALGSTMLTVLHSTILNGGDLPDWLKSSLETLLRIKR